MPLQSKVNDMLMEILIHRVLARADTSTFMDEAALDKLLQEVGEGLGFKVRLESYHFAEVNTLKEALDIKAFLFIGYYFYLEDGQLKVVSDVPRSLAQMPYPSQAWVEKDHELLLAEAMRLGSTYMSQGVYPREAKAAQEAYQLEALELIDRAIKANNGKDVEEVSLRFAVGAGPHGPESEASLFGLRKAVERSVEELWLEEEPLPSTSTFIEGDWADEVEKEEERRGADRPTDLTDRFKKLSVPKKAVPTHPVTWKNWGRKPPTAVWGPPKPARQQRTTMLEREPRAQTNLRRGKILMEESDEEWFDDSYLEYDEDVY
jgi:hypothetical protein